MLRCATVLCLVFLSAPLAFGFIPNERPFRLGIIKMAPGYDQQKPLGIADYAGWIATEDVVIGAINEDWVAAYSARTKRHLWWINGIGGLTVPPVLVGSWVLLCFRDGSVKKVDVESGRKVWELSLNSFASRTVTKSENLLLIGTAGQTLYAIDSQTGSILWLFDAGNPEQLTVRTGTGALVHKGRVYFGLHDGELVSVDVKTGKQVARVNPKFVDGRFHDFIGEMAVVDDKLYFSRNDGLVGALSVQRDLPELAWSKTLENITAASFRPGRLYVGGFNGTLRVLNPSSGDEVWNATLGRSISSITAGERNTYVATHEGLIGAFATDGTQLWTDHLGGTIVAQPFFLREHLYFPTATKVLYGFKVQ